MTTLGQWLEQVRGQDRRDCELLLDAIVGVNRAQIIAYPERELSAEQLPRLTKAIEQLRSGVPLAYILGHQEFWSLDFYVSPTVLIPRPETELLVERVLALAPQGATVLDLGTGSGAIAISIAHSRPDLKVTATDQSTDALDMAYANAARHKVDVNFVHSNWFEKLSGEWQVIVSNPPYIAIGDEHLKALTAEPQQALTAGPDGLDDLRIIVHQAPGYLAEAGQLILEHGYNQAADVRNLMQQAGLVQIHTLKDLAQIERATLGCRH